MRSDKEIRMRLEEIDGTSAAERRVKRMKDNAKAAKEHARQLRAQADMSADRLEMQKDRAALVQAQRSAVTSTIKPYR
jgi:DNA repair exonuclease SbcCD ATPase subunit